MKKMQDEMNKLKDELSKKVEDVISGKNDATKDYASDVGAANDNVQGKGVYSSIGFDYGQLMKGPSMHFPTINHGKPPHFDGTRYTNWSYKMKCISLPQDFGKLWMLVWWFLPMKIDR